MKLLFLMTSTAFCLWSGLLDSEQFGLLCTLLPLLKPKRCPPSTWWGKYTYLVQFHMHLGLNSIWIAIFVCNVWHFCYRQVQQGKINHSALAGSSPSRLLLLSVGCASVSACLSQQQCTPSCLGTGWQAHTGWTPRASSWQQVPADTGWQQASSPRISKGKYLSSCPCSEFPIGFPKY